MIKLPSISSAKLGLLILPALSACGGSGSVEIKSTAFAATSNAAAFMDNLRDGQVAFVTTEVTDLKFCVKRVKIETEAGKAIDSNGTETDTGNESGEIEFSPGLIDLSTGAAKSWGEVTLPTGFTMAKIKVKVKKDAAACSDADYSVSLNGETTPQDIEFKWKFDPAVSLDSSVSVIELAFHEIITTLADGNINSLKDRANEVEGIATVK